MARKQVETYAIFHNVGGTSSIVVHYDDGFASSISDLSVEEAHYIIDFLRNEGPMDYDHERRRFMAGGREPVGEGES